MIGIWRICLLVAASLLIVQPTPSHAGRVALVVGISDYAYSPRLTNPGRDAVGVTRVLEAAGFDVMQSLDADMPALLRTLEAFYVKAEGAEAALFFFGGHGLQFEGVNYLVTRDARLKSETRLKQEAIALQDIIASIEKRARITLVFLDACRDNPLAEELQRSANGSDRSAAIPRGLAPMRIRNPDTLLVFAASPGRTASDGAGANSPFTTALIKHMGSKGVEIELMMKRVTRDVVQSTNGEQIPERLSRLTSDFEFVPQTDSLEPAVHKSAPVEPPISPSCSTYNPSINCLWPNK